MKMQHLQSYLRQKKLSHALFLNFDEPSPGFAYFAQYDGYGCLLVPQQGKPFLLTPKMEAERARQSPHTVRVADQGMKPALQKYLRGKHIAFDGGGLTVQGHTALKKILPGKKLIDIAEHIADLRATKTASEIAHLRKGCRISDAVYRATFKHFHRFDTEQDVANFMEEETRRYGCKLSFDTIVASGRNAAMPHHKPLDKQLQKGFCVIDFGVKYKGYCTDTTRTVFIGKPTKEDILLYHLVLKAQEASIKSVKVGMTCASVYDAAVRSLGSHAKYFIHGLGHGVGLQIHEKPNIGPKSDDVMHRSTLFTIEPGIYLPNKLGIRIEDTLLLTHRPEPLTHITKKLLVF